MADKSSKAGRNADYCKKYKLTDLREKHKAANILRHWNRYGMPYDRCAAAAYNKLCVPARTQKNFPRELVVVAENKKRKMPKVQMNPDGVRGWVTPKMPELATS